MVEMRFVYGKRKMKNIQKYNKSRKMLTKFKHEPGLDIDQNRDEFMEYSFNSESCSEILLPETLIGNNAAIPNNAGQRIFRQSSPPPLIYSSKYTLYAEETLPTALSRGHASENISQLQRVQQSTSVKPDVISGIINNKSPDAKELRDILLQNQEQIRKLSEEHHTILEKLDQSEKTSLKLEQNNRSLLQTNINLEQTILRMETKLCDMHDLLLNRARKKEEKKVKIKIRTVDPEFSLPPLKLKTPEAVNALNSKLLQKEYLDQVVIHVKHLASHCNFNKATQNILEHFLDFSLIPLYSWSGKALVSHSDPAKYKLRFNDKEGFIALISESIFVNTNCTRDQQFLKNISRSILQFFKRQQRIARAVTLEKKLR